MNYKIYFNLAIISSVLLTKVLGKGKDEEKKLVQTYRMLSCSEKEGHHEKKHRNRTEFPFSSVYKPSIGTVEKKYFLVSFIATLFQVSTLAFFLWQFIVFE